MLSKAQSKHIRSLTQQKFRDENRQFTAEGSKIVLEWLNSDHRLKMIVATVAWAALHEQSLAKHPEAEVFIVRDTELESLSSLRTTNHVLAVIPYPEAKTMPKLKEWYLALDGIQDPGNMGTIIRIADWFGIRHVICAPGCVDVYNSKVIQSAMGGHLRVNIYQAELTTAISELKLPVFAATLDGDSIYDAGTFDCGVLVIGNESNGVSLAVASLATRKISIPGKGGAESLNAAVSAGILCAMLPAR